MLIHDFSINVTTAVGKLSGLPFVRLTIAGPEYIFLLTTSEANALAVNLFAVSANAVAESVMFSYFTDALNFTPEETLKIIEKLRDEHNSDTFRTHTVNFTCAYCGAEAGAAPQVLDNGTILTCTICGEQNVVGISTYARHNLSIEEDDLPDLDITSLDDGQNIEDI